MKLHAPTAHDNHEDMVEVTLTGVEVDGMATIGFGHGTLDDGTAVIFWGDHRPMRALLHAFATGEADTAMVPTWAYRVERGSIYDDDYDLEGDE